MGWIDYVCIASKFGVTEPQLMVMDIVRLHVPIPYYRFAWWVLQEFDHFDHGYLQHDLQQAINQCIANRWLRVLNIDDMYCHYPNYSTYLREDYADSVGLMDWTELGNQLAKQIFGDSLVKPGR